MKKKQPNLNLRKELLRSYLLKLTNNRVALIENDVIRAENLTYSICQNRTEVDLGEVKLTVSPYSYNKKKVYSSVLLQLFKKEEEVWKYRTRLYANQYYLNFVSELNRVQIEKLIKALKPIIDKIDEEVAKIEKEENQTKSTTIMKNLKESLENWPEDNADTLERVVSSVITGTPFWDVTAEEVVYTNNYKKESIKDSLQNYVLTKLNNGVNGIQLHFIFELEEFDKFSYSNFIQTLNENDGNLIHEELKSYLAEFLEFEQDSYGLNVNIKTINDPMDYGELVKVTAVIVIP